MTHVRERDPSACLDGYRELAAEILALAIDDYQNLRTMNAIRADHTVDEAFWCDRHDQWGRRVNSCKPRGITNPSEAHYLVFFFQSPALDRLCETLGVPACRVRSKLGFAPKVYIQR